MNMNFEQILHFINNTLQAPRNEKMSRGSWDYEDRPVEIV